MDYYNNGTPIAEVRALATVKYHADHSGMDSLEALKPGQPRDIRRDLRSPRWILMPYHAMIESES